MKTFESEAGEAMKELEAIRDLARELSEHSDMHIHSEDLIVKAAAAVEGICADRIKALLPALDIALREKSADKATVLTMRMLRTELDRTRAEIAALRELMSCGHPRACWQATKPDSIDAVVGYRCVACEDKRLAVEMNERKWMWQSHGHAGIYGDDGEMQCGECHVDYKREPMGFVTAAYQKARMAVPLIHGRSELDAHDAALWNDALEEAAESQRQQCKCFSEADNQSNCGQCYRCWVAQEIRALKREKR